MSVCPSSVSAFAHIHRVNFTTLSTAGAMIHPHFIDEKTRQGEVKSNLCKLTQLVKD